MKLYDGDCLYIPDQPKAQTTEAPVEQSRFALYPNPAAFSVTVAYQVSEPGARLLVRDLLGRTIAERDLPGEAGEIALDTGEWAPGAYVCTFVSKGKTLGAEKLIIAR